MEAKDWQTAAKLIREIQSQATIADSSQLSIFPLSELSLDDSGPPTVLQGYPQRNLSLEDQINMVHHHI